MAAEFPEDHPFREKVLVLDDTLSSVSTSMRYLTRKNTLLDPNEDEALTAFNKASEFVDDVKKHLVSRDFSDRFDLGLRKGR